LPNSKTFTEQVDGALTLYRDSMKSSRAISHVRGHHQWSDIRWQRWPSKRRFHRHL